MRKTQMRKTQMRKTQMRTADVVKAIFTGSWMLLRTATAQIATTAATTQATIKTRMGYFPQFIGVIL
jgi:hypothetical protein